MTLRSYLRSTSSPHRPCARRQPASGHRRHPADPSGLLRELAERRGSARGDDRAGAALRGVELPAAGRRRLSGDHQRGPANTQPSGRSSRCRRRSARRSRRRRRWLRSRMLLGVARQLVRNSYQGSRAISRCAAARRRSTCARRSSARCASRCAVRCAASTPRRSRGCWRCSTSARDRGRRVPRHRRGDLRAAGRAGNGARGGSRGATRDAPPGSVSSRRCRWSQRPPVRSRGASS